MDDSGNTAGDRAVNGGETESAARVVDPVESPIAETIPALGEELDPQGVITAAVLLHTGGDVDAALDGGSFTRAELDAARAGLADGTLDYLFE